MPLQIQYLWVYKLPGLYERIARTICGKSRRKHDEHDTYQKVKLLTIIFFTKISYKISYQQQELFQCQYHEFWQGDL